MSIPDPAVDGSRERSKVRSNGEAWDWLEAGGWDGDAVGPFHASGDRLMAGQFHLSRVWHTRARIWRHHRDPGEPAVLAIVGVEGDGVVRSPGVSASFGAGRMVVASTEVPLELDFEGTSARLELTTSRRRLGLERLHQSDPVRILDVHEGYSRHLGSLVNSVLASDVHSGDAGFPALRDAVESTATALIAQSGGGWTPALTSARAELMRRAWRVIEERHVDPEFSIAQLSDALQVSATHLHRVFAATSLTPLQALQERRARRAAALLNQGRVTSGDELAGVAAQSGFPSVAVMRRALNRAASGR